jgi:hypothetical protein
MQTFVEKLVALTVDQRILKVSQKDMGKRNSCTLLEEEIWNYSV